MAVRSKRLCRPKAWTNARWRVGAIEQGNIGRRVHQAVVQQGQLDLVHVQADEIRVKGCKMIAWMGLAMMVSTRLWLGGVVSLTRDRGLADGLLWQVRSCCQPMRARLLCTDGWKAYPGSIRRAFCEEVKETAGRGRACLRVWSQLCIAVVIKHTEKKRVVDITRKLVQGTLEQAQTLLAASEARNGVQYRHNSTLEWHHTPATRQLDAQMSACGQALGSTGKWYMVAWLHLQFLLAAS